MSFRRRTSWCDGPAEMVRWAGRDCAGLRGEHGSDDRAALGKGLRTDETADGTKLDTLECHAADLRRGARVPLPPHHDDQVRARHDARPAQRGRQPAPGDAVRARRRNEREGQRVDAGGLGAARGGMARGAVYLAAPGVLPRAYPGGRRADRRERDGDVDRAAPAAHPRAEGHVLRGYDGYRLRRLRGARGGDRGGSRWASAGGSTARTCSGRW